MDRNAADSLARFCIAQSDAFNLHDWLTQAGIDGKAVALAAKYLSMTSWYGHEEVLEQIAENTQAFIGKSTGLYEEMQAVGLDLQYFSLAVRSGIALLHGGQSLR